MFIVMEHSQMLEAYSGGFSRRIQRSEELLGYARSNQQTLVPCVLPD